MLRPGKSVKHGFSLAEILITLVILGVVAAFSISKTFTPLGKNTVNSKANQMMLRLAAAHQAYKMEGKLVSNTHFTDLIPYFNYVKIDSSTVIDELYTSSASRTCGSGSWYCLVFHDGSMLMYNDGQKFGGPGSGIYLYYDPDGKRTDSTTNSAGKSLQFWITYDGRVRTSNTIDNPIVVDWDVAGYPVNDGPWNLDPPWLVVN